MKNIKNMKTIINVISVFAAGLFSAMAGSDKFKKYWRRFVIPIILIINSLILTGNWLMISLLALAIPLSMGHGIPSKDDDGSTLGKLAAKFTNNSTKQDILVRSMLGILKGLSCLAIPVISGNYAIYAVFMIIITAGTVIFGGNAIVKNEGYFNFLGTKMLWEEFIIAAIDTLLIICLIYISFII